MRWCSWAFGGLLGTSQPRRQVLRSRQAGVPSQAAGSSQARQVQVEHTLSCMEDSVTNAHPWCRSQVAAYAMSLWPTPCQWLQHICLFCLWSYFVLSRVQQQCHDSHVEFICRIHVGIHGGVRMSLEYVWDVVIVSGAYITDSQRVSSQGLS